MAPIQWQTNAKRHVRVIFNYYKEHASLAVASAMQEAIIGGVDPLEEFPLLGIEDKELSTEETTYYYIVVKRGKRTYRDYYIYDEQRDICYILAIWDCSMNPVKRRAKVIPIRRKK